MFDKGIYEDTLNNLRMMEREYNLKNYNQIAPQINCDIIEELIKRHLELVENHDKYKKALDILKEQHDYLASNMHYNYPFSIEMLKKVQSCFENLIEEHEKLKFAHFKKLKENQDER